MNDEDCVDYEDDEEMERYAMHLPMRMIGMARMMLIPTFPYGDDRGDLDDAN